VPTPSPDGAPDLSRSGIAGHPKALSTLFLTEMWERFSYYGMRALLMLFMVDSVEHGGFGFPVAKAAAVYGLYTASVYLFTIPGGWVADRLLGLRNAVLLGGVLIALGHYTLVIQWNPNVFYSGLLLIVLGTGLLKANVSSIVGQTYERGDPRLDAGFSIFYMGINLGAFLSPIVCGYLGQRWGWHWGFGAAGVGMTLGLVQYVLGLKRLGDAGRLREPPKNPVRLWGIVLFTLAVFGVILYNQIHHQLRLFSLGAAVLFAWLFYEARDAGERKRVVTIVVLFVFAVLFWAGFEQAGSSLTLFADQVTRNVILDRAFPSTWYQSVEPICVIALAPVFAWLWTRLGRRDPSSGVKFSYALLAQALGYLALAYASLLYGRNHVQVSPWWLLTLYFFQAVGELCLSPVGLSTVTKLAPERHAGLMMGVWFLALSLGNLFGGQVAGLFNDVPMVELFGGLCLVTAAAGVVLLVFVPILKRFTFENQGIG
jgi:POT family proton-dependent oligopeptide transporter